MMLIILDSDVLVCMIRCVGKYLYPGEILMLILNNCCSAAATAICLLSYILNFVDLVPPLDNEYFAIWNPKTGIPCSEFRKCQIKTQLLCRRHS